MEQILVKLLIFAFAIGITQSQSLTLYKENVNTGTDQNLELELNVDNCTNIPEEFLGDLACGNFSVECAQFYDNEGCTGHSAEIRGRGVTTPPFYWKLSHIKSVGPCHQLPADCTNTPLNISHTLELFDNQDYKGRMVSLSLNDWTCQEIPRPLKGKLSSLRFNSNLCVQLYAESGCADTDTGITVRRKKDESTALNLKQWGFDYKAKSISSCGFDCRRNDDLTKNLSRTHHQFMHNSLKVAQCPHVTLYDESNFTGNAMHVTVRDECVSLEGDFEGTAESVVMHVPCVILYSSKNCSNSTLAQYQLELNSIRNSSVGYNLEEFKGQGLIRSLGPCYKKRAQPLISLYMLAGMFFTGVFVAAGVNKTVRRRDRMERTRKIYQDKPT